MRIGIDIDNTLYPLAEELREYFSHRLGYALPTETHWDSHILHWGLSGNLYSEIIGEGVEDGDLFRHAEAYPGASEATWRLSEAGHTIVIATARRSNPLVRKVTRDWLLKESIYYDELIFDKDKRAAAADIFIDDKPTNIPVLLLAGVRAVYFDQPWNRDMPYPRVKSWAEFADGVIDHAEV